MIELKDNRLVFSFLEVHREARLSIEFQRTLRIPDGTGEIQRRTIARQMLRGDTVF